VSVPVMMMPVWFVVSGVCLEHELRRCDDTLGVFITNRAMGVIGRFGHRPLQIEHCFALGALKLVTRHAVILWRERSVQSTVARRLSGA
jgi:hypothetical protein